MALNANKVEFAGGGVRIVQANLEAGNYPARVVQVLDLGVQPQKAYKGVDKAPAQEISLTYELVDEFMKDEDGEDILDKPRWVSESFVLHNLKADLAKSTKRYNAIDPQGVHEGDFSKLLDTPVMVTVVNNAVGDKIYDNVGSVGPMRPRDAEKCPPLVNEAKFFNLDEPDMEVFGKLPKWLQDKIKGNLRFQGSVLQKLLDGAEPAAKEEKPKAGVKKDRKAAVVEADDNDPPFDVDNNPY